MENQEKFKQIDSLISTGNQLIEEPSSNFQPVLDNWIQETKKILPQKFCFRFQVIDFIESVSDYGNMNTHFIIDTQNIRKGISLLKDTRVVLEDFSSDKNTMFAQRLVRVREEDSEFELKLAERICGDNNCYPYRTSSSLTKFFKDLGYPYVHDGSTRKYWVQSKLLLMDCRELITVIQNGLFNKRAFQNGRTGVIELSEKNSEESMNIAIEEFRNFIKDEAIIHTPIDLNILFDSSANMDYFFQEQYQTNDQQLNELIKDSKNFFRSNNGLQTAVEKLWDAFERIKTLKNVKKNDGTKQIVNMMVEDIAPELIESEFQELTTIGNQYAIRHHEVNKVKIFSQRELSYLYFRLLALVNFALEALQNEQVNNLEDLNEEIPF